MKSLVLVIALCGTLAYALPIDPGAEHASAKDMAFAKVMKKG